jgi:hypothetical protein
MPDDKKKGAGRKSKARRASTRKPKRTVSKRTGLSLGGGGGRSPGRGP